MLLTNSQYEHLMSHYYHQQLKDNFILKKRMKEVYDAIPQMNELENRIRTLSVQHAASRLKGQTDSIDLDAEIDKITKQKEALLLQHGYPADYLKPVYECADCKDTGYIDGRKCHCFEKLIVQYLYSQSNLKDVLEHENFSHFNLDFYPDDYTEEATGETPRDNMRHILETVKSYLSGFSDTPGNLLLYGNTGVGKTFLTNCIAKELLDKSHTVVYLTSLKLFDILESCKFDRDLSQTQKNASLSYLLSSDLLIIDDLGTELNNSFTSSQLYHCIDTRLTNRRSTIISTNLSFDDLRERYSERIFSRITSNYTLLKITGDDIRLKKAIMQH